MNNDQSKRISFGPKLPTKQANNPRPSTESTPMRKAFYISLRDLKRERKQKSRSQSKDNKLESNAINASSCFEKIKALEQKWIHIKDSLNNKKALTGTPSSPRILAATGTGDSSAKTELNNNRSSSNCKSVSRKQHCARFSCCLPSEFMLNNNKDPAPPPDKANIEDDEVISSTTTKPRLASPTKPFTATKKLSLVFGATTTANSSINMTPQRSPHTKSILFSRTSDDTVKKLIDIAKKLKSDLEKDSPERAGQSAKCHLGPRPVVKKLEIGKPAKNREKSKKKAHVKVRMRLSSLNGATNSSKNVLMQTCKSSQPKTEDATKPDFSKTHHVEGVSKLLAGAMKNLQNTGSHGQNDRNKASPMKKRVTVTTKTFSSPSNAIKSGSQNHKKSSVVCSPQRVYTEPRTKTCTSAAKKDLLPPTQQNKMKVVSVCIKSAI